MATIKTAPPILRLPQREIEAFIGGALLKTVGAAAQHHNLKKSKLQAKSVHLPKCKHTMFYHEREAANQADHEKENRPTILFFHGISQKSEDFAALVSSLDIPPHIRVLVPEQGGHGRDIDRARLEGRSYVQPTHETMLETTSEFLDAVRASGNCNAFGISLGGAVCYYVSAKRPDIIKRTVLVSPAIIPCVDKDLVSGIRDGTNNFLCFESRRDVTLLFRDLSTGRDDGDRRKKDPVPKFFHEAVYRSQLKAAPRGHWKNLVANLLTNAGLADSATPSDGGSDTGLAGSSNVETNKTMDIFTAETDIDRECRRLVIWPEEDRIISCRQGKQFFRVSKGTGGAPSYKSDSPNTEFEIIPDCGHIFHADGTSIMDLIRPRAREYLLEFTTSTV